MNKGDNADKSISETLQLPKIDSNSNRMLIPSKLKPGLDDPNSSAVSDWLTTSNVPRIISYRFPSEKYTVPATTSQDIGWPWNPRTEPDPHIQKSYLDYPRPCKPSAKSLEIYGRHGRGKGDVFTWFGCREALP